MKLKCIIFGASRYGYIAYQLLRKTYEVIGFADNDSNKWEQRFCEKVIFNPNQLVGMEGVQIIIASQYYSDINIQLHKMGIKDIKVFYYTGDPQMDIINKKYKLYFITDKKMFEDCVFDIEKIKKINEDFSENYKLSEINEKRRKVLFCAYIFPPLASAGVQRSLKFVKYLKQFGYEPIVLTVGEHSYEIEEDYSMLAEVNDVQIIRIDFTKFLPELLSQEEQQEIFNLYAGIVQNEKWMNDYLALIKSGDTCNMIPDNKICWVNECLKQIESKVDLSEIDIVYTTGVPFSTFILGYYLKCKYGIKWVQDYRDPWGGNDFYIENYYQSDASTMHLQQQLEKVLVGVSDAIIVAAEAWICEFAEKYGLNKEKIVEITNGYDEDDFKDIELPEVRNNKFTLCYNGALYGDRNPIPLLQCINKLIEQKQINPNKIQWIFNGMVENKWKQKMDAEDKYRIIIYSGYLNHKDSIESAMKADILVLFSDQGKGAEVMCPGKVFEYIRMKTDILAFSSIDGVIGKLLQKTKTGRNFEYDDYDNIEKYIFLQYENWKNEIKKIDIDDEAVQKYSRENTTKLLAKVFNRLIISAD